MKKRNDCVIHSKAQLSYKHELVIAVKQNNLELIEEMLLDRSNPTSSNYQKWLSYDEVGKLTTNLKAYKKIKQWLNSYEDTEIIWESPRKEYIKVVASIDTWSKALNTEFFVWTDSNIKSSIYKSKNNELLVLCDEYYLPNDLVNFISTIFNTNQVPPIVSHHQQRLKGIDESTFKSNFRINENNNNRNLLSVLSNAVTVSFLDSYYRIPSNKGSPTFQQSVFETSQQSYSPNDLNTFQQYFDLTIQPAVDYNGYNTTSCANSPAGCDEGNLDIQYIMGVAQSTVSIYWYVEGGNPFLSWITTVASESNPPMTNSISWGTEEQSVDSGTLSQFQTEAIKVGLLGVTVTVSSGDNGVSTISSSTSTCECNNPSGSNILTWSVSSSWSGTGYFPSFPATCPYVTAVGATMGPNSGNPEIACQSQLGGVITSGGGFSTYYSTPSWQTSAVNEFFTLSPSAKSGYNKNGRGFPDISLIGVEYAVVVDGQMNYYYGTSCSSPVFAAFITLINTERLAYNQSAVGFINPTLYAAGANKSYVYYNDVTEGSNHCCSNNQYGSVATVCCGAGFNATNHWDPVTGWGSIYYTNLSYMLSNGVVYVAPPSDSSNSFLFGYSEEYIIGFALIVIVLIVVLSTIYYCCCKKRVVRANPPLIQQRPQQQQQQQQQAQRQRPIGQSQQRPIVNQSRYPDTVPALAVAFVPPEPVYTEIYPQSSGQVVLNNRPNNPTSSGQVARTNNNPNTNSGGRGSGKRI